MAAVTLRGLDVLVDDDDLSTVHAFRWRKLRSKGRDDHIYFRANLPRSGGRRGRQVILHRLLLGEPAGVNVDHVNGNTLDNRRANLRPATPSQNQQNRHAIASPTGIKGITWHKKARRWQAAIKAEGRNIYLGLYQTAAEAGRAYDAAATRYFGEFARINAG